MKRDVRSTHPDETQPTVAVLGPQIAANIINGTAENDRIVGTAGADTISGLEGDDLLLGKGGDDLLIGGKGNDTLNGGKGFDTASFAGSRADLVIDYTQASGGFYQVYADGIATDRLTKIESIIGGDGDDRLILEAPNGYGYGKLSGGGGDDVLGGSSRVDGGDGDDTIYGTTYSSYSIPMLAGGDGARDVLTFEALDRRFEPYLYVFLDRGYYFTGSSVERGTISGFEDVVGSDDFDYISGDGAANVLRGGDGSDTLVSNGAASGHDVLSGEAGGDILNTDNGEAFGGEGDDYVQVFETTKPGSLLEVHGDEGYDQLSIFLASDTRIDLTAGAAQLADGTAITFDGIEAASAGRGDDIVLGDGGDNRLGGSGGADILTGGAGADRFLPGENADDGRIDRITDFSEAEGDHIDLTTVTANTVTGHGHFRFIGSAEFTGAAKELRFEVVDGNTFLQGDTDGDGAVDYQVQIDGVHMLVRHDLILT